MATSAIAVFAAPLAAEAQEAAKVAGPTGHSATSRRCREGGARGRLQFVEVRGSEEFDRAFVTIPSQDTMR